MPRSRTRSLSALTLAALVALALSACADASAAPTSAPTPAPTRTAAPEPEPTPTEPPAPPVVPANLPTDCGALGTETTRQETVGDMTLQGDAAGFIRPAPEAAQLALGCDWIIDEVAGVLLLVSTADPAAVTAGTAGLAEQGWTCGVADDFGAAYCVLETSGQPDTEEAVVARDDVWIYLETYQRNARALLSEIAQQVWN